jgi:putative ABC transport system permease protein
MLLTFLAVALGVAFVGGVLVLTDTMNRAFDDLFADVYRNTDAVVRSDQKVESDFGPEVRGNIDEALLPDVEDADGVAGAEGNVGGYARIIDRFGDPVGNPEFGAPTLGGNWSEIADLNPFNLAEGRAPRTDDEVVIDRASANATDFVVGDQVDVQTRDGVGTYTVSGIARFGTADSPGGASYVLWTTDEAQRLLVEPGKFSSIVAAADSGVSQDELAANIRDALPADAGAQVVTGAEITKETQDSIKQGLSFLTIFFGIFAGIAVFVGIFVIYNSFAIIVAQRTREMALLRAIGARRRQIRRSVVVEAAIVGFLASVVGFIVGLGVATLLGKLLQLPEGALAVLPSSIAVALATGVIVTVLSALVPAWRASRVPPLAAMRDVAVDTTGRSRIRVAIGLALLALGIAAVVLGAFTSAPLRVGIGAIFVFAGILFLAPALARPVSSVFGRPVARLRGVAGQIAKDNAGRNPRRTAATAAALTIGIGLVTFIMVINTSIRASFDKTLEDNFAGDFVIDSGTFGVVGLPTTVADQVSELPDVEQAVPIRFSPAFVNGDDTFVTGSDDGIFGLLDIDVVRGEGQLGSGDVVITEGTAKKLRVGVGDPVDVRFLDDARLSQAPEDPTAAADCTAASPPPTCATVTGVYEPGPTGGIGDYVVGLDDFDAAVPDVTDAQVFVQLKPGVSVAEAQPAIEDIVAPYVTAQVQSVDEYKDAIGNQLNIFLLIIVGLLSLAIIIAMLGIFNTIALSVLERTRELGLLRAVGMRRRQIRSAVRWESAIISLFGTFLGLCVGLLGGWGIVRALRDDGFQVFQVPIGSLLGLALAGIVVGLVAALIPAWQAGRMNVLDAINTE